MVTAVPSPCPPPPLPAGPELWLDPGHVVPPAPVNQVAPPRIQAGDSGLPLPPPATGGGTHSDAEGEGFAHTQHLLALIFYLFIFNIQTVKNACLLSWGVCSGLFSGTAWKGRKCSFCAAGSAGRERWPVRAPGEAAWLRPHRHTQARGAPPSPARAPASGPVASLPEPSTAPLQSYGLRPWGLASPRLPLAAAGGTWASVTRVSNAGFGRVKEKSR